MSLINDALKRAKQAQQKNTPPPASAPMRPVETTRRPPAPRSLLLPVIVAAALTILGGVVLILIWNRGSRGAANPESPGAGTQTASRTTSAPSVPSAPPPQTSQPAGAPALPATVRPAQSPATNPPQPAPSIPTIVTQTLVIVERPKPEPVVQAVPAEPLPKLQGILFNPAKPTAFLNGKSYVVGGRVGEFRVVAITRQAVTVERAGQTNVLTMEE